MLPIVLDSKVVPIGVAGGGDSLRCKLDMLAEAGTAPRKIFDGIALTDADLAGLKVLFIAGLDDKASASVAALARARGVLVNVEDKPELCDFHVPAQMRRGELLFTVSTGGKSPGLSRALREELERRFGPEWSERLDEIARLREVWRAEGATADAVALLTRHHLDANGWLG
jgi:precorrin-2 dehydrogenase / sirohydrochlorin ferrochelatase